MQIIKKTSFLIYILLLGCCYLFNSCANQDNNQKANDQPNIVFLFADDMTYTAVNALGNSEIHTPNLDKLVRNGVTFTHTYNMGGWNGAICAASRAMIISGRSIWRANQFRKNWGKEDTLYCKQSWGKLMEQAGYDTYMSGKWHVDAPPEKMFQTVKHIRPGMPKDTWNHHEIMRQFKEVVGKKRIDGKLVTAADVMPVGYNRPIENLSLIHISEPTRPY